LTTGPRLGVTCQGELAFAAHRDGTSHRVCGLAVPAVQPVVLQQPAGSSVGVDRRVTAPAPERLGETRSPSLSGRTHTRDERTHISADAKRETSLWMVHGRLGEYLASDSWLAVSGVESEDCRRGGPAATSA
jgi:hypothetical protein